MKLPRPLAACSPWRRVLGPWVRSPVPGGWSHTRTYRRELAPWVRRLLAVLSPWREAAVCRLCGYVARAPEPHWFTRKWHRNGESPFQFCRGAWCYEPVTAPWVRNAPWWLAYIVAAGVGMALGALLFPMPADAQSATPHAEVVGGVRNASAATDTWTGDLLWRGERIELRSCCGPMREPVIRRELEACLDVVRADLGLDVAIPKLGAPGAPYTIEVVLDPVVCQKSELCPAGADCSGCSVTVHDRYLWTKVVMRDRLRKRAAPVKHECRHRLCVAGLRAAVVPIRTMADLLAIVPACQLADHGAGKGYRWDVAGRRVPARKGQ